MIESISRRSKKYFLLLNNLINKNFEIQMKTNIFVMFKKTKHSNNFCCNKYISNKS